MIRGSCLCGGIQFEIDRAEGPFELCHCNRCRKVSGSAFVSGLGVKRKYFRLLSGDELVRRYQAPILEKPPAYTVHFCDTCGCSLPDVFGESDWLEIPAGLLDDDPEILPDKHIFVELKAPWFSFTDKLPKLDKKTLYRLRNQQ